MEYTLPDELKPLKDKVCQSMRLAEPHHNRYRARWDHFYALYRSYKDFRDALSTASARDRDKVLSDGQTTFGAELFIPYCFSTVETIIPRMLSNDPRMLITPDDDRAIDNVQNMKLLIDKQQENAKYALTCQETAKSGLIFGLGAQKGRWRQEWRIRTQLARNIDGSYKKVSAPVLVYDDPYAEDIDIYDCFWDPMGYSSDTLRWVIHRTWRDRGYIEKLIAQGQDPSRPGGWTGITLEQVDSLTPKNRYDDIVQNRRQYAKVAVASPGNTSEDASRLHEVWEFHDGDQCITVLDDEAVVKSGPNPDGHGELPFRFYRPSTAGMKQLPGIGEIEPIEDLQSEMNELRSQRRDNARFALHRVFAYSDGMIDPGDFQVFPGAAIPVNGDPRELLFPLPIQDIPNSSYQEEGNLTADIDRTTGVTDPSDMGTGAAQTATGVQMVQAAASQRIQNKTKLFELEVIAQMGEMWVAMNQARVTEKMVTEALPPQPGMAEASYMQRKLTPEELQGRMIVTVDGGATAPDNIPQMRSDAQMLFQMIQGNTAVDQQMAMPYVLKQMGVKNPESWMAAPDQIPSRAVDLISEQLVRAGLDPNQVQELISSSVDQAMQEQQGGPEPAQDLPSMQGPDTGAQAPPDDQAGQPVAASSNGNGNGGGY